MENRVEQRRTKQIYEARWFTTDRYEMGAVYLIKITEESN